MRACVCRAQESTKGFDYFCMSKFALGLPGGEHGTSLVVTKQQQEQLEKFVAPNTAGFFNFGTAGFTVLSDIAVAMAQKIPFLPATQTCLDAVKAAPYWCVRLLFFCLCRAPFDVGTDGRACRATRRCCSARIRRSACGRARRARLRPVEQLCVCVRVCECVGGERNTEILPLACGAAHLHVKTRVAFF